MLTILDICHVCDLKPRVLHHWIVNGYISPAQSLGQGLGRGYRFSLMQSVGLVVAAKIHQSHQSCSNAYITDIVKAFGDSPEELLLKEFSNGLTHFVAIRDDKIVLKESDQYLVDVQQIYQLIKNLDVEVPESKLKQPKTRMKTLKQVMFDVLNENPPLTAKEIAALVLHDYQTKSGSNFSMIVSTCLTNNAKLFRKTTKPTTRPAKYTNRKTNKPELEG